MPRVKLYSVTSASGVLCSGPFAYCRAMTMHDRRMCGDEPRMGEPIFLNGTNSTIWRLHHGASRDCGTYDRTTGPEVDFSGLISGPHIRSEKTDELDQAEYARLRVGRARNEAELKRREAIWAEESQAENTRRRAERAGQVGPGTRRNANDALLAAAGIGNLNGNARRNAIKRLRKQAAEEART